MNVTVEIERRDSRPAKPEWICPSCKDGARLADVRGNLFVCPYCGFHARVTANERIRQLADPDSFRELWMTIRTLDPLTFTDLEAYPDRVREAQAKTGLAEAILTGTATIDGNDCVLAVMDFGFIGGSMGSVVGERIVRAAERALSGDAAGHRVQLRRRPDAGGPLLADADGQDARPLARLGKAGCRIVGPRRSDHRRGGGELRDARRRHHRRAGGPALFRGPARDHRHDARAAAEGLRQRRAQPRAGSPRRRSGSQGPEGEGGQLPAAAGRG